MWAFCHFDYHWPFFPPDGGGGKNSQCPLAKHLTINENWFTES